MRRSAGIDSILAPTPGPVMLFGDVGEMQEVRERTRHRKRLVDRHPAELIGKNPEIVLIPGSAALCEGTNALDPLEQRPPGMRLKRLTEQLPQQPHVVTQRLVRID